MTPFVIVADLRTGSTLLHSTLDTHPQIRCYGELFHPQNLPDNQVPGHDRYALSGRALIHQALVTTDARATGFRAMIFLPVPSEPRWADAWESLRALEDLRVIYLWRQDRLAQYASLLVAQKTGVYHPYASDADVLRPENRPTVTIDPGALQAWVRQRDELFATRRQQLSGKHALEVQYEQLVNDWDKTMLGIQHFLRVDTVPLSPAKQKQETRPLRDVVANYTQLVSEQKLF
jgi:LPS sulfotransferase NodH